MNNITDDEYIRDFEIITKFKYEKELDKLSKKELEEMYKSLGAKLTIEILGEERIKKIIESNIYQ